MTQCALEPTPAVEADTTVLCITGMHRSATSLVASWLQLCGLTVDDGRSLGPRTGNLKGHFEDMDFVELHAQTLSKLRPRSGGWLVKDNPIRADSSFDATAKDLIALRNNKFALWGWKDPRTSLFLRQWKRLIPGLKVVLLWRRCKEVVESLLDRAKKDGDDDVPVLGAAACWRAYNTAILDYKIRYPDDSALLPVDAVLANDKKAMETIASRMCPALHYQSIANIYDPPMLKSRPSRLPTRLASRLYNAASLEEQLRQASDLAL